VKLRIYPGLAPMLAMPIISLLQDYGRRGLGGGFGVAFSGGYLGLIPLLALNLLQYSQQWQASDVFRLAPMPGPAPILRGARLAVGVILTLPTVLAFALLAWCVRTESSHLPLLLPGIIALPVYSLFPQVGGRAVPLSVSSEEAKSASRGLTMIGVMFISMALSGVATWSWAAGWFQWFLFAEIVVAASVYAWMRIRIESAPWLPIE
jgi:ABC-2 type transport system permease protein